MANTKHASRGISLVEVCVGLCMSGILTAQAVPAFERMQQRQRLQLSAQALMTDIQQARSEAVQSGQTVYLRFSQSAQGSCYIMHTGTSGQCRCDDGGVAACTTKAQMIKLQWLPASQKVAINANVQQLSFQARQGTVASTGSVDVQIASGESIRHVVSIAGRVRSCSPQGAMAQFTTC
nr:GspH/FimT family pseudopilin [uncultured Roseateles sp.]